MRRVSRGSFCYSMAGISIRDEKTGGILLFRAGLVHSLRAATCLEAKVIGRPDSDVRSSLCSAVIGD